MDSGSKAQLVKEICSLSSIFLSCKHHPRSATSSAYVDWYLILGVEDNVEDDVIRRKFRALALQLHPDKNKHPKAEVAFKLVSEAYTRLSDKSKRRAFNLERSRSFCNECIKKQSKSPTDTGHSTNKREEKKSNKSHQPRMRITRNQQVLREAKRMLEEEARVIAKCLSRHGATTKETPLFDPAEYMVFPDYPHCRTEVQRDLWWGSSNNCFDRRNKSCKGGRKETPVYETTSEKFRSSTFKT